MDFHYNKFDTASLDVSGTDSEPDCVTAKVDSGSVVWTKVACGSKPTSKVVCQRPFNWQDVAGCYGQPPEEASNGTDTYVLTSTDVDRAQECSANCKHAWYFDLSVNKSICHCIGDFPKGGEIERGFYARLYFYTIFAWL